MPYTYGSLAISLLLLIPTVIFLLICILAKPSQLKVNQVKFSNSNPIAVLSRYAAGITVMAAITAYFWLPYVDTPEFGYLRMLGEWLEKLANSFLKG